MPVDVVSLESLLGWAIAIIAFLVGMLLALKDECRDDMQAIRQHQDELDAQMDQLNTRVSHLEGSRKFVE